MIYHKLTIPNKLGLHARAAAQFVKTVERFNAEIRVQCKSIEVSGNSIMGIMMLTANQGEEIMIKANGPEANLAIKSLSELIVKNFNESE